MNIFKILMLVISLLVLFISSGCKGGSSDSTYPLVVNTKDVVADYTDLNTTLASYSLESDIENNLEVRLESNKFITFFVKDDKNVLVEDSSMVSMTIKTITPDLGTLADISTSDQETLTFLGDNFTSISLETKTKSGLVTLEVTAVFIDIKGDTKTLIQNFNLIVLSGPPSAMSLSYVSTVHTTELINRAKFVERWALSVTDKYNNPVNTNPAVAMGMIAGYADNGVVSALHTDKYLMYSPINVGDPTGTIDPVADTFTATASVFGNVDLSNDILVTYGLGYVYNASGKWDIETEAGTILGINDYNSSTTSGLGFAVGNNHRQKVCATDKAVATVYPDDGNYTIDDSGSILLNVEYDYYLVGKSTMVWANLNGKDYQTDSMVRIGEAKKVTLRGLGLNARNPSRTIAKGTSVTQSFILEITDTMVLYRNAYFSYSIETTGSVGCSFVRSSESDISDCSNDGVAYVTLSCSGGTDGGTVSLTGALASEEF